MTKTVYLIGSLRNPEIPKIAKQIRQAIPELEVFDDWFAAGPTADDCWQEYEKNRGHSFDVALSGYAARHVFEFDKGHLDRADMAVLVLPAGKSGHLELGYMRGMGKRCYILVDKEPDRYDVMYQFADGGVFFSIDKLIDKLVREVYTVAPITSGRGLLPAQGLGNQYKHWAIETLGGVGDGFWRK